MLFSRHNKVKLAKILKITKIALITLLVLVAIPVLFTGRRVQEGIAANPLDAVMDPESPPWLEESKTSIDSETILRADLFDLGVQSARQNPNSYGGETWSKSTQLRLIGTVAGSETIARAIIQDKQDNSTKIYRIGDRIGGASLLEIREQDIVLRENGRRKILRSSPAVATRPRIKQPPLTRSSMRSQRTPVSLVTPAPHTTLVADLMTKAHIAPTGPDKPQGLEITGLEEIPMAKTIGLRDGDIIRVVNGQTVDTRQKAFQVLRKAKSQKKLILELTRGDQEKTLSFP